MMWWLSWAAYILLLIFLFILCIRNQAGPAVGGSLTFSTPTDQEKEKK